MMEVVNFMNTSERAYLNFAEAARKSFAFLGELGFSEIEALPTFVRYRKGDIEVDVYHGRQSYEIGAGVTAFGTRYAISEIIRHTDPDVAMRYHYPAATTPEGVVGGLEELSTLMKRYGRSALDGNPQLFSLLEGERKLWSEEYALDVLARQLRPQAAEAFRQRDYSKAADLYARIRERLSQAEIKKLSIAEERLIRACAQFRVNGPPPG
jgi:hypothetical protein